MSDHLWHKGDIAQGRPQGLKI